MELVEAIKGFVAEREWDQFHSPKNLSMALSVEVSEIVELFQWLTPEESDCLSPQKIKQAEDEIGDVMICLFELSNKLQIDPMEAASQKLEKNKAKYPVELVRGKALKYNEY